MLQIWMLSNCIQPTHPLFHLFRFFFFFFKAPQDLKKVDRDSQDKSLIAVSTRCLGSLSNVWTRGSDWKWAQSFSHCSLDGFTRIFVH